MGTSLTLLAPHIPEDSSSKAPLPGSGAPQSQAGKRQNLCSYSIFLFNLHFAGRLLRLQVNQWCTETGGAGVTGPEGWSKAVTATSCQEGPAGISILDGCFIDQGKRAG